MMLHDEDRALVCEADPLAPQPHGEQGYYAEVWARDHDEQSRQIELLIDIVFGALGARHLAVRVCPTE
jgi:hypothetical protein